MKSIMKAESGFTLVELLVAGLMASIISFASFEFYGKMHNSTLSQEDVSDMQMTCRNTLDEMSKTIGNAGFKIYSGAGYSVVGDSIKVFYQGTNPVDSVVYFLQEFTSTDYDKVAGRTADMHYYKLMKKENGAAAVEFATNIKTLTYNVISANTIDLVLTLWTGRIDDDYSFDNGFRTLSATQRVYLRNLS
ncbi:MAG: prepilin-type N-terminal cleavage/methylation domain-containing protein [Candidatus Zixiibacteriota bacterium]